MSQAPDSSSALKPLDEAKKPRRHKPVLRVPALNITSMMDLVLNLLLFFVLTSNFALTEGILPTLPRGGSDPPPESAPPKNEIAISLRSVGPGQVVIQIEGTQASLRNCDDLSELLYRWNRKNSVQGIYSADNPITIKPDRSASWNQVVEAFNAVIRAKYTDVGFAPSSGWEG